MRFAVATYFRKYIAATVQWEAAIWGGVKLTATVNKRAAGIESQNKEVVFCYRRQLQP